MNNYKEPTLLSRTRRFQILASIHDNELSIEFRLYEIGEEDELNWEYGGFLKWDGCLNWETNPRCMAHFCDPEAISDLAQAFEAVGVMAIEHVKNYEGNFGRPA